MSQQPEPSSRRLHILSASEVAALYGRPHFSNEERAHYFALSAQEQLLMTTLHTFGSRIAFILQLGYFKASQQFFTVDNAAITDDVAWIHQTYFPQVDLPRILISKSTRLKQQALILQLGGYRLCEAAERDLLQKRAQQAVRLSSKPIFVLRNLRDYLAEQKIVAPGYTMLQDIISVVLSAEQQRLGGLVQSQLSAEDTSALLQMLANPQGLYEITRIKREPKDFGEKEMRREIERGAQLEVLYKLAQRVLPTLQISSESIKYYASLVGYYSVYKLRRFEQSTTFIYLLCFVHHRYQQMHDNLVNCLIYQVHRYNETSRQVAKERIATFRNEQATRFAKAGQVLHLMASDNIEATTSFAVVQASAFAIVPKDELVSLADALIQQAAIDEIAWQWAYFDERHIEYKRRIRPILRTLTFEALSDDTPLLAAIRFIQAAVRDKLTLRQQPAADFPLAFVPDHVKRYLYKKDAAGKKQFVADRYEFLVYRMVRHALIAGDLFCHNSSRFRSLEDDLVDDARWQKKDKLLTDAGLQLLQMPVDMLLDELETALETRIETVNKRITDGQNAHIKRGAGGRWSLPYTRVASPIDHRFYRKMPYIDIQSVITFVHQQTGILNQFKHVRQRYVKHARDDATLSAALVAWGTNMGMGRMGNISDVGFNALVATSDSYLRLETLKAANDVVSDAIATLPIFHYYNIAETVHSSSDGQKFETRLHTINARHSSKYFGLKKGVVAYTLVANHVPLNAQVIGTHEHESHYVLDLLLNNTTSIQPTIHSTDTHGTNHVNFALLHVFGYQFAPRYKDIYDKVQTSLYGFQHPSKYPDSMLLKPIRKVQRQLIVSEWNNLLRIFLSLALKTTTQSIIVGKLSSYARKNRTKRALWEFDNILRSLYLLDFIDSLSLRRYVQRALGRGEGYHQLRRAVSFANFGALRFKTEGDQQLWSECSRLLTNCIIYYNATILSGLLEAKLAAGDAEQIERLARVSPIAWRHVNFQGRYEFRQTQPVPDIDELVQTLAQHPITLVDLLD